MVAGLTLPGLVGIAGLASPADAIQEEPTDSYVVIMAADPVVAYDGGEPGLEATEVEEGEKLDVDDPAVEEYVEFLEEEQAEVIEEVGIESDEVRDNFT